MMVNPERRPAVLQAGPHRQSREPQATPQWYVLPLTLTILPFAIGVAMGTWPNS